MQYKYIITCGDEIKEQFMEEYCDTAIFYFERRCREKCWINARLFCEIREPYEFESYIPTQNNTEVTYGH